MPRHKTASTLGLAAGVVLGRVIDRDQVKFARLAGSSIASVDPSGWITDFLNAAYYRRPEGVRQVDDLRLAFAVITTYWHRNERRRLRAADVLAFHRAFGRARLCDRANSARGTLNRGERRRAPDLQRRNRNLIGGDVGGGSYTLDQVVFRPLPSLSPYRTPVHGLYLASAATFPGGAVHGVPGHAAARVALLESSAARGLRAASRNLLPRSRL